MVTQHQSASSPDVERAEGSTGPRIGRIPQVPHSEPSGIWGSGAGASIGASTLSVAGTPSAGPCRTMVEVHRVSPFGLASFTPSHLLGCAGPRLASGNVVDT